MSLQNQLETPLDDQSTQGHTFGWIMCPVCAASCRDRKLRAKTTLQCRRCGSRVKSYPLHRSLQPAMAFSAAGLFAAVLANLNPILTFSVSGRTQDGFMLTGVVELFRQGYWPLALLVFFASILAPILYLASIFYVSFACVTGWRFPWALKVNSWIRFFEPWNLVPVFAIATVVSVVKLRTLGTVEWDMGARWVLGMSFFSLSAFHAFDRRLIEGRIHSVS
jgi:paraquat-inducible protein A